MYTIYLDPDGVTTPLYDRVMELRKEDADELEKAEEELSEAIFSLNSVENVYDRLVRAFRLRQGRDMDLPMFVDIRRIPHSDLCRYTKFVRTFREIDKKNYNFDRPLAFYEFCKILKIGKLAASYLYDEPNEGLWGLFYELNEFVQSKSKNKQLYLETHD